LLFFIFFILFFYSHLHLYCKVSATVKDTSINGIEGLNINIAAPFKYQDYILGFKYNLGGLKKVPESLFVKRTFKTDSGSALLDADFTISNKVFSLFSKFNIKKLKLNVEALFNSKDTLKTIGFTKDLDVQSNKLSISKLSVSGFYDLLTKKQSYISVVNAKDTNVKLTYDTQKNDPVLEVLQTLDSNNDVYPSISLKTGDITYGWTRKWDGGSLKTQYFPSDKVALQWKDEGTSGNWITKADIPLDDQTKTKLTFSREWNY
jgi:hypothetical protein